MQVVRATSIKSVHLRKKNSKWKKKIFDGLNQDRTHHGTFQPHPTFKSQSKVYRVEHLFQVLSRELS